MAYMNVLDWMGPIILIVSTILCGLLISTKFSSKGRTYRLILGSIFIYISVVILTYVFDYYLSWKLDSFDLDGNLIFTNNEATDEQYKYQQLVMNDLGRNLVPFTMLILSPLLGLLAYLMSELFQHYICRVCLKKRDAL